jgi:hypothetical protein
MPFTDDVVSLTFIAIFLPGPQGPPNTPVLFIPGNAGTYKQGNAFGAESARHWDRQRRSPVINPTGDFPSSDPLHAPIVPGLDWYLVDFKEELSAFHGSILVRDLQPCTDR